MRLTAGSYRYFVRGASEKPSRDDLRVSQPGMKRLAPYDHMLRQFKCAPSPPHHPALSCFTHCGARPSHGRSWIGRGCLPAVSQDIPACMALAAGCMDGDDDVHMSCCAALHSTLMLLLAQVWGGPGCSPCH
jgi:hypothetical protein